MAEIQTKLDLIEMSVETYQSLTDETITDDQLADLRFVGADPPPLVSKKKWAKRIGDKDIPYRHKAVIHQAALGESRVAIAEKTGYSIHAINDILSRDGYKERIAHQQATIFRNDAKGQFKALYMKAYGVVEGILENQFGDVKASVQLEAAKYVLDHVAGKANQVVEHKVSLLGNLMNELDRAKDVTPHLLNMPEEPSYVDVPVNEIEVESQTEMAKAVLSTEADRAKLKDLEIDDMDALVEELVPSGFTLGKRDVKDEK